VRTDLSTQNIADFTPHARPMLLLDRAIAMDEEAFEAELEIRPDSEFCVEGQVGAWVGIEYMAQAVAAFAGAQAKAKGEVVKVGFLLGTRHYRTSTPHFKAGSTLRIRVKKVLHDPQGLSVVDCSLHLQPSGQELAAASLTVFEVPDFQQYLKDHRK
jgi:predicted hotdog family 3-hydroxylacyl-ACP dehydratase